MILLQTSVIKGFLHFKALFRDGWELCAVVCCFFFSLVAQLLVIVHVRKPSKHLQMKEMLFVHCTWQPSEYLFYCHSAVTSVGFEFTEKKETSGSYLIFFFFHGKHNSNNSTKEDDLLVSNDMVIFDFFNYRVVFFYFRLWHLRLLCTFLILSCSSSTKELKWRIWPGNWKYSEFFITFS